MPWMIPHPPVVWEQVRPNDIWLILAIGAGYEFFSRFFLLLWVKRKSAKLKQKETQYQTVTYNTNQKRKLGPSAFVETSKLERQLLSLEKELDSLYETRTIQKVFYQKMVSTYGNMIMMLLVFTVYYGIPIATVGEPYTMLMEGYDYSMMAFVEDPVSAAEKSWKMMLFPISYLGMGPKISKWGMHPDNAATSISALMVYWSGQVTMEQIMNAVDAFLLS